MNELNASMRTTIARHRPDIDAIDWDNVMAYGRLKNGRSYVVPVTAYFSENEAAEPGWYAGNMIIEIRDGALQDYSVGDWEQV